MTTFEGGIAIDTNILAYAECVGIDRGEEKQVLALQVLERANNLTIPSQALFELAHLLIHKARRDRTAANSTVLQYSELFAVAPTTVSVTSAALELSSRFRLQIFDAVIIAAAAEAGCRYLLSEDLQSGATMGGVTILNPFLHENLALVAELIT